MPSAIKPTHIHLSRWYVFRCSLRGIGVRVHIGRRQFRIPTFLSLLILEPKSLWTIWQAVRAVTVDLRVAPPSGG